MSIPQRIVMLSMNKVVDFTAANKQSETECESMGSEEGGRVRVEMGVRMRARMGVGICV